MDHQKLAKTLLRVLSIGLIAQSIAQLSNAFYITLQVATGGVIARPGFLWSVPLMGGVSLAVGLILFMSSDRLARMIAADGEAGQHG